MSVTIKDSGPAELPPGLANLRGVHVLVGIRADKGADLVAYAAANEFGVPGTGGRAWRIPPRPFLRSTAHDQRDVWGRLMTQAAREVAGGAAPNVAFGRVGLVAVGDVQRKIVQLRIPPNAPSTIRRKGSSNPLIDTGRMRQSIDYRVEVAPSVPPPPARPPTSAPGPKPAVPPPKNRP